MNQQQNIAFTPIKEIFKVSYFKIMSCEQLVLLYSSLGIIISAFLITLNNIREDAEKYMYEPIDFTTYIKKKAQGDEVDQLIAKRLEINEIAA